VSQALAEIEALSAGMRRSAGRADWEAVEAALSERDRLVRQFLAAADPVECAEELRRLLNRDREILALARDARDAVAAELRRLDDGRKAVHAYGGSPNRRSRRTIATATTTDRTPAADSADRSERPGSDDSHDSHDSHERLGPLEA